MREEVGDETATATGRARAGAEAETVARREAEARQRQKQKSSRRPRAENLGRPVRRIKREREIVGVWQWGGRWALGGGRQWA